MKIEQMDISQIRDGIKDGSFTAVEVITSLFERIKTIDPKVKSYLKLCEKEALDKAKIVDKKIANNEPVGTLAGVPIAIKDNICIDGISCN